jgi:hypothetical protein
MHVSEMCFCDSTLIHDSLHQRYPDLLRHQMAYSASQLVSSHLHLDVAIQKCAIWKACCRDYDLAWMSLQQWKYILANYPDWRLVRIARRWIRTLLEAIPMSVSVWSVSSVFFFASDCFEFVSSLGTFKYVEYIVAFGHVIMVYFGKSTTVWSVSLV